MLRFPLKDFHELFIDSCHIILAFLHLFHLKFKQLYLLLIESFFLVVLGLLRSEFLLDLKNFIVYGLLGLHGQASMEAVGLYDLIVASFSMMILEVLEMGHSAAGVLGT